MFHGSDQQSGHEELKEKNILNGLKLSFLAKGVKTDSSEHGD